MRRRLVALLFGAAAVAPAIQQSAGNLARCPHCGAETDGPHGWLVTSVQSNVIDLAVNTALQTHVCPRCGVVYCAL